MALTVINIVLCVVIVALGYLAYKKKEDRLPIYVSVAFAIFGISHIITLLGFKESLMNFLIIIRAVAYLLIVLALFIKITEK